MSDSYDKTIYQVPFTFTLKLLNTTKVYTMMCAQTNALPHSQAPAQLFAILEMRRLVIPNTCLESAYTRSSPYIQVVDRIKMADNTNVK